MGFRSKEVRQAAKKMILPIPIAMPCKKGHEHIWPTTGPITKEDVGSCQTTCQFCSMDETKPAIVEAKWPWHLRRHIYQVHKHTHPGLLIPEEWSGKKSTSKGKSGPKKGEKRTCTKKTAVKPVLNDINFETFLAEVAGPAPADNNTMGNMQIQSIDYADIDWEAFMAPEAYVGGLDDMFCFGQAFNEYGSGSELSFM